MSTTRPPSVKETTLRQREESEPNELFGEALEARRGEIGVIKHQARCVARHSRFSLAKTPLKTAPQVSMKRGENEQAPPKCQSGIVSSAKKEPDGLLYKQRETQREQ